MQIKLKSLSTIIGMGQAANESTPICPYLRMLPFCIFAADIPAMKANRSTNAKLVVVIEDDPLVLEATAGLLCSWGFKVIAAPCFEEAMKQLCETGRRPDLIVSDYRLPEGATGVDAIEGLRNAFEIPALLISGDARCPQADVEREGYQLLHKPVNADSFRAALIEACVLRQH